MTDKETTDACVNSKRVKYGPAEGRIISCFYYRKSNNPTMGALVQDDKDEVHMVLDLKQLNLV